MSVFRSAVLFALLVLPGFLVLSAQSQLGQNLNAEASGDRFGNSVALSGDGSTVAVGGFFNDGAGQNAGHVRVFELSGSQWTQAGDDLDGTAATDFFGTAVALSADGSIVAVGASGNDANAQDAGMVRVFNRQSSGWEQLGNTVLGDTIGGLTGNSVALSASGDVLAVGSFGYRNGRGQARVYELREGTWAPVGARIIGGFTGNDLGVSVALSADGSVLAVGASSLNNMSPGSVRLYQRTESGYAPLGEPLVGGGADSFGESISLSADGNLVAVGAPFRDMNRGSVTVYSLEGDTWQPVGSTQTGLEDDDFFGFRVGLSADGDLLAVSAPRVNANGLNAGATTIFAFSDGDWAPLGERIVGSAFSQSGLGMAFARSGDVVAVGAEFLSDNETQGGQVRVFGLFELTSLSVITTTQESIRVFPNPTSGEDVTVEVPEAFREGILELVDMTGRVIIRRAVTGGRIRTAGLKAGVYMLRVQAGGEIRQERLIIR